MKVVVLTTSYPRDAVDVAGAFVASSVEGVRALGIEVDVVSPDSFQDFGIAYGGGIAQNLRAAPWKLALLPVFLAAYARAARHATRDADLVHAHWIPSALAARATGKPYVLQVWGTDVELARRAPALFGPLLRGAELVLAASTFLADAAGELGAREVRVVPFGVHLPDQVAPSADPPHVLFAGRLSEEKGILEFLEATEGLERVIVGDGPLRCGRPRGGRLRASERRSGRGTSVRRLSVCRHGARVSEWERGRRWRTDVRWSRPGSEGSAIWRTSSSCLHATPRRFAARSSDCSRTLCDEQVWSRRTRGGAGIFTRGGRGAPGSGLSKRVGRPGSASPDLNSISVKPSCEVRPDVGENDGSRAPAPVRRRPSAPRAPRPGAVHERQSRKSS